MENTVLKNIWTYLSENNAIGGQEFDSWKENISSDEKVQNNVYTYLNEKKAIGNQDFDSWKDAAGLKKKDSSGEGSGNGNGSDLNSFLELPPIPEQGNNTTSVENNTQDYYDQMAKDMSSVSKYSTVQKPIPTTRPDLTQTPGALRSSNARSLELAPKEIIDLLLEKSTLSDENKFFIERAGNKDFKLKEKNYDDLGQEIVSENVEIENNYLGEKIAQNIDKLKNIPKNLSPKELEEYITDNPDILNDFDEAANLEITKIYETNRDAKFFKDGGEYAYGINFEENTPVTTDQLNSVNALFSGFNGNKEDLARYLSQTYNSQLGDDLSTNRLLGMISRGTIDLDDRFQDETGESPDRNALIFDLERQEALGLFTKARLNFINVEIESLKRNPEKNKIRINELTQEQNNLITSVQDFNLNSLPALTKYLDNKKIELAEEYVSGDMGNYQAGDGIQGLGSGSREILEGGYSALVDTGSVLADFVGLNGTAENLRLHRRLNEMKWTNPAHYSYANGVGVKHDGVQYIVTPEGQIIDEERYVNVAFFGEQAGIDVKAIREKAKTSTDYDRSSFSKYGAYLQGANVIGNLGVQLVGMKGTSVVLKQAGKKYAQVLTVKGTQYLNAAISTGAIVYSSVYNQTLEEARLQGVREGDAVDYAGIIAREVGAVAAITSVMSPNLNAQKLLSKIPTKDVVKKIVRLVKKPNPSKIVQFAKGAIPEGILESVQENIELYSEDVAKQRINNRSDKDIFRPVFTRTSVINNSIAAFSSAGLLGGLGARGRSRVQLYNRLGGTQELFTKYMKKYVDSGVISQIEADNIVKEVENYHQYKNSIPKKLRSTPIAIKIANLLAAKNKLKDELKNEDDSFSEDTQTRIDAIDQEIKRISNEFMDETSEQENVLETENDVTDADAIAEIEEQNELNRELGNPEVELNYEMDETPGLKGKSIKNAVYKFLDQSTKDAIFKKKQEILKRYKDANKKSSTVSETEGDTTQVVSEVDEGVPGEISGTTGESDSDTNNENTTTTEEEVKTEDEVVEEIESETEQEAEESIDNIIDNESETETEQEADTEIEEKIEDINKNITNPNLELDNSKFLGITTPFKKERIINNLKKGLKYLFPPKKGESNLDYNKRLNQETKKALEKYQKNYSRAIKLSNLLSKLLPNTKIYIARSQTEYNKLIKKLVKGDFRKSVGVYSPKSNAIIVNGSVLYTKGKFSALINPVEILAHEALHALFGEKFYKKNIDGTISKSDANSGRVRIRLITEKAMLELQKTLKNSKNPNLINLYDKLNKFTKLYKGKSQNTQSEEYIVEAFAQLVTIYEAANLSKSKGQKIKEIIKDFINSIADVLGIKEFSKELNKDPDRVLRSLNAAAKKLVNGEQLSAYDFLFIEDIDEETKSSKENSTTGQNPENKPKTTFSDGSQGPKAKLPPKKTRTDATTTTLLGKISRTIKGAIRQTLKQQKEMRKSLMLDLKASYKSGNINVKQARILIERLSKLNIANPFAVDRFIKYTKRILDKADFAFKLKNANVLRKKLKKLSRSKTIDAAFSETAKNFALLDPLNISNLDNYIEKANELLNGVNTVKIKDNVPVSKEVANLAEINKYVEKQLELEKAIVLAEMQERFEALTGISSSDLTYNEMLEYLKPEKSPSKKNEGLIRKGIKKLFDQYSEVIKKILKTGIDPATNEELSLTEEQKIIISKFINMDLSVMDIVSLIKSVDALNSFIVNTNTGGMEAVVSLNKGASEANTMAKNKKILIPLKKFQKLYNKLLLPSFKYFSTLPMTLKTILGSLENYVDFQIASGLRGFTSGKSRAKTQAAEIASIYLKKFKNKRPNNELFNSQLNTLERGVYAFLTRTVSADVDSQIKEYKRRKKLLKESIDKYKSGNTTQVEIGNILEKIYNKIKNIDNASNIDSKFNKDNRSAVRFWQNEWKKTYPKLKEVNYNIYNSILGNDVNYTPDKLSLFEGDAEIDLENTSSFSYLSDLLFSKKAGVLFESKKPNSLPGNRVVNFNFDSNMLNSIEAAKMDVETSSSFLQIKGFLQSPEFSKIIPDPKVRELVMNQIKLFLDRSKKQNFVPKKEKTIYQKTFDVIANFGVTRALAGFFQPLKQTIPVMFNTLINSQGNFDLKSLYDTDIMAWMNRAGTSVSQRGGLSSADIAKLEKFTNSDEFITLAKDPKNLLKIIKRINDLGIEYTLVKPDKAIATISFISYYKQKLKEKGIDVNNINWKTHKTDVKALAYAEAQVDLNQNISDSDMFGEFFQNEDTTLSNVRKMVLPFASFAMNLKVRIYTDTAALANPTTDLNEKKRAALSLAAAATEITMFHTMGYYISAILSSFGYDDDEEKRKRRLENYAKGRKGSALADVISPFPQQLVDGLAIKQVNKVYKFMTDKEEKLFFDIDDNKLEYADFAGQVGITLEKISELTQMYTLAYGNREFTDSYGNLKTITKEASEELRIYLLPLTLYNFGLMPAEIGTVGRYKLKQAMKSGKTKKQRN